MTNETLPLHELSRRAVRALTREIGVVGTLRFLGQYTTGHGDYTKKREAFLGEMKLDDLIKEAKRIDEERAR